MRNLSSFYLRVFFVFCGFLFLTNCQRDDVFFSTDVSSNESDLKCVKITEKPFKHLLLFQFNENTSLEVKRKFIKALSALKDSIKEVKAVEWGTNLNYKYQGNIYSLCFLFTFNNTNEFMTYVQHSAHTNFVTTWLNPNIHDVMAFDYFANEIKASNTHEHSGAIRHFELLNYADDLSSSAKDNIVSEYTFLSKKIRKIQKFEWGTELQLLGLNMKFDDAFVFTFRNILDYHSYSRDLYVKNFFNKIVNPNTEATLTIDYFIMKY